MNGLSLKTYQKQIVDQNEVFRTNFVFRMQLRQKQKSSRI